MRSRIRLLLAALIASLAAYGAGIAADPHGLRKYAALGRDIEAIELKNAKLRGEIDGLRRELAALGQDRAALERTARDELGLVRAGEWQVRVED